MPPPDPLPDRIPARLLRRLPWRKARIAGLPPFPVRPICVIGDVHGRADLLRIMLGEIIRRDPAGRARCIFVGDLIDRGPESAAVLKTVHRLCRQHPARWFCVAGNHERMLLDFLDAPARHGPRWLAAGGEATVLSFDLSLRHGRDAAATHVTLAEELAQALPDDVVSWLRALPLFWQEGQIAVTHAGADPALAMADQPPSTLLWGRGGRCGLKARMGRVGRLLTGHRADGLWIVQGHVPQKIPRVRGNRILVDTGAWSSGRLSAAWLEAGQTAPTWLTARIPPAGPRPKRDISAGAMR